MRLSIMDTLAHQFSRHRSQRDVSSVPLRFRSRVSFRTTRCQSVRYESGVSRLEPDLEKKKNKNKHVTSYGEEEFSTNNNSRHTAVPSQLVVSATEFMHHVSATFIEATEKAVVFDSLRHLDIRGRGT